MASKPHWDVLVRLTHWLVAALVMFNLLNEEGEQWHRWAGYAVVGLVLLRLVWGLGLAPAASPARLRQWWPTVSGVLRHLRQLTQTRAQPHAGHNPLGALMALALWGILLALGATGWMPFGAKSGWKTSTKPSASLCLCWCLCMWPGLCSRVGAPEPIWWPA